MVIREITREEWIPFLDTFSRQHRGWLVNLEVAGPAGIRKTEASEQPLVDVAALMNDNGSRIAITAGEGTGQTTCIVESPRRVHVEQTSDGADAALIVDADEETAVVRFRSAAVPERVDGW